MDKFKQAMAEAAVLAAEKEAHAAQVQAKRAEELREIARKADLVADRRRLRYKKADIKIDPDMLKHALRNWRLAMGIKKRECAAYLGVTEDAYRSQEEHGRAFIAKDYYEKLKEVGVDLPELEQ